jgi:hypothetical protein
MLCFIEFSQEKNLRGAYAAGDIIVEADAFDPPKTRKRIAFHRAPDFEPKDQQRGPMRT